MTESRSHITETGEKQPHTLKEVAARFAAGTALATTLFSLGNAATGTELPWTKWIGGGEKVSAPAIIPGVPRIEYSSTNETVQGLPTTELNFSVNEMPFSSKWELSDDPEAAKLIDPEKFDAFVGDVKSKLVDGATVKSVTFEGFASDEAIEVENADPTYTGLGKHDLENVGLAQDRAEFLKQRLADRVAESLDIDPAKITTSATENVLDEQTVKRIDDIAKQAGYATTEAFIIDYNKKVSQDLLPENEALLRAALNTKRGASVKIEIVKIGADSQEQITTETCVLDVDRYRVTYEANSMPFTVVPFYIPRKPRRKNGKVSENDENNSDVEKLPDQEPDGDSEAPLSYAERMEQWDSERRELEQELYLVELHLAYQIGYLDEWQRMIKDLSSPSEIAEAEISKHTQNINELNAKRVKIIEQLRNNKQEKPRHSAEWRRDKIKKAGMAALAAALPFAFVQPGFYTCDNDKRTPYPRTWNLERSGLDLSFRVPFTDIATTESFDTPRCADDSSGDGSPSGTCDPTEIRIHDYLDGELETSTIKNK